MLKYAFLGSPQFASRVLEGVVTSYGPPEITVTQSAKAFGRGQKTQPTAVGTFARAHGLDLIETDAVNAEIVLSQLQAAQLDTLVVVAFGQILREALLSLPRLFLINLHGSLLPRYRGAAPVQWAIWNGDSVTGITVQKMAKRLDSGEVILQEEIAIKDEDTSTELLDRMIEPGTRLLVEALKQMEAGSCILTTQDESLATFAPKLDRTHSRIDWTRSAIEIQNQVRSTLPWPGTEFRLGGRRVKIIRTQVTQGHGAPGNVICDSKRSLQIQCGSGRLALTAIQPENRKPVDIAEFLVGFRGNFPYPKVE